MLPLTNALSHIAEAHGVGLGMGKCMIMRGNITTINVITAIKMYIDN
jgi:hypothetical protein